MILLSLNWFALKFGSFFVDLPLISQVRNCWVCVWRKNGHKNKTDCWSVFFVCLYYFRLLGFGERVVLWFQFSHEVVGFPNVLCAF